METFFLLLIGGLVTGCIYALVAAGYAVLYTATGFVNFAIGAQAMVAGYLTYALFPAQLPFLLRLLIALVVTVLISIGSWTFIYRRVAEKDMLAAVIMSFGLSIVIAQIVQTIVGGLPLPASSPFGLKTQDIAGVTVSNSSLGVIGVSIVLFIILGIIFRSRGGKSIRAMFQDREMAETLGVPTNWVVIGMFALSGVFASAAGILVAPQLSLSPDLGTNLALTAFAGAILGGLDRISTAITGAVVLGLLETFFAGYVSQEWRAALVYGVFILVLVIRPVGVFGKSAKVKV
jgi:branched-chain amino acid transport system permease protein